MTGSAPPVGSARAALSLQEIAARVAGYDPDALPVPQAQEFIARVATPVTGTEDCALRDALGRVLATDVISGIDVPPHDNSAMDGFALRGSDLRSDAPAALRIVGSGLAGQAFEGQVPPLCAVRITTGAVMPAELDTVLPQEFAKFDADGRLLVPPGLLQPGDNRRLAGEDLARGEVALASGRLLRPADLGLLASLGLPTVSVRRPLRVAFFSTGDEIRSIGEALDAGSVYDSNRYTVWGMLQRLGVQAIDLGVVRDEPHALRATFLRAAAEADAVITSGGVSVGEADHTKRIMAELGEVLFWRIAMRPGRPMAIGRLGVAGSDRQAVLFGLPGNPVAVMVTFYAFVRDALLRMSGATPQPLPMLRASCTAPIRKKPGRTEFQRGIVSRRNDGQWQVAITGAQGSGILRSMSLANGMVVLHHEQGNVAAGEAVDVLPFDGLV